MPINQNIVNGLNNPEALTQAGAQAALAAVLAADRTNANQFREAFVKHKEYWAKISGIAVAQFEDANFKTTDNELDSRTVVPVTPNTFEFIHKLIAQRYVELAIQKAPDNFLEEIIKAPDENSIRGKIATYNETKNARAWEPATENVLTNDAANNIRIEAQKVYLARKINAATDLAKIDGFLNTPVGDANFQAAVKREFGISDDLSDTMSDAELRPSVFKAAAKKGFGLYVANSINNPANRLEDIQRALSDAGGNRFFNAIPEIYKGEHKLNNANADDKKWAKKIAGEIFFKRKFNHLTADEAKNYANSDSLDNLRTRFNLGAAPAEDSYIYQGINESNYSALREIAATQAVKHAIRSANDPDLLYKISRLQNLAELKQLLAATPALNLDTPANQNLRDALASPNTLKEITAVAYIRAQITPSQEAKPDNVSLADWQIANQRMLRTLLAAQAAPDEYAGRYGNVAGLTDQIKNYFKNPENINQNRREVLEALIKVKLKEANEIELTAFANANTQALLQQEVFNRITTNQGDDLIVEEVNAPFNLRLRAYAKAELIVRTAKTAAENYDAVLARVNDANFNAGAADARFMNSLPEADKKAYRVELLNILISKYDFARGRTADKLVAAATAKTLDEFKASLSPAGADQKLGVTNTDWINEDIQKTLQQTACQKGLAHLIGNQHPNLLKVVAKLPLEKQQALLVRPDIISALQSNTDEKVISRGILGGLVEPNDADVIALVNENKQRQYLTLIHNAPIASLLEGLLPDLQLNADKVKQINDALLMANPQNLNPAPPAVNNYDNNANNFENYRNLVSTIARVSGFADQARLYQTFGLTERGDNIGDDAIRGRVATQQGLNVELRTRYLAAPPLSNPQKKIVEFLLTIDKQANFTVPANLTEFTGALKSAKTKDEFLSAVRRAPINIDAILTPNSLNNQLTHEKFIELKQQATKEDLLNVNAAKVTELTTKLKSMSDLHTKLVDAESDIRSELKKIGRLGPAIWLNPIYQAAAKQKAAGLLKHFEVLDKDCEIVMTQLNYQLAEVQSTLKSLPSKAEIDQLPDRNYRNQLNALREELKKHESSLNKEIKLYSSVQKVLHGDPDSNIIGAANAITDVNAYAKKGWLALLREASTSKKGVEFSGFNVEYKDYTAAELKTLRAADRQTAPVDTGRVGAGVVGVSAAYSETSELAPGKIREYCVGIANSNGQEFQARYTEQRDVDRDMKAGLKDGKISVSPSIRLETTQVPRIPSRNPNKPGDIDPEAGALYYVKLSMHLVAAQAKKDLPIRISSTRPDELAYWWCALVHVCGVDPKNIVINGPFHPDRHKNWIGSYKGDSPLGQAYQAMQLPHIKAHGQRLEDYKEKQTVGEKETNQAQKAVESIAKTGKFRDAIKNTETENRKIDASSSYIPTPRL